MTLRALTSEPEIAALSVSDRIPRFWQDQAKLWFTQFEAIVATQKQGEDYKYNLVIAQLSKDEIRDVSDIITNPPAENKYQIIKDRLISCYEESKQKKFQHLFYEMDLGDKKPSQLLRQMKELGQGVEVTAI